MQIQATSPEDYIAQLPDDRKEAVHKLRHTILNNLPKGFDECMQYGMISYVVPLSTYPSGYLSNPAQPLPFVSLASQKGYIALYHMGITASEELRVWFEHEYPKHCKVKLDMGKSCIRFKKVEQIPYELLAELLAKISIQQWIVTYEKVKK